MIEPRETDDAFFKITLGIFKDKAVITKSPQEALEKKED